jgi:DNA-binding transcriptional MerR regulator
MSEEAEAAMSDGARGGPARPGAGAADRLYTVTELGRDLGVTARTIRFYEDKGLISPRRAGNTRVYTHRDRARMILILRGKRLGFSLREIKDYLDLYAVDVTRREQLRLLLKAVSSRIERLEDQQAALEQTLAELREIEAQAAAALRAHKDRRTPAPV